MNSDELIGFVHLPSSDVRSPTLERDTQRTKAAPLIVRNATGLFLGNNVHMGESIPVRLSANERVRHTYIIGATGTGKSTLLFNLIRQDIENGQGVGVLDPAGDLIDRIMGIIPDSRINDVVFVNPSDMDFPIGFNILSAHSDIEKNQLASDLVSMFRRLSTSWGDQMDMVLRNAILAFLESSTGGTLSDLRRFLIEDAFRNPFLATVREPEVVYYWQKVFPHLTGSKSIGPVLTRLQTFLSQKPIRLMVSQRENRLDFGQIMDTGKIFLAKLPEGIVGVEDAYLLGTLLVSKFQQLAMARQAQQVSSRRDFWLYIDEFDRFITPSMAGILSSTRKYRFGLTLAHHEVHRLQKIPEVASAVMSHPATRIVFQVSDDDAKKFSDGFSFFEARDMQNLATGQAICRVGGSNFDFNLSVPLPEEVDEAAAAIRREEVITASREKYGTPRAQVDAILSQALETLRELPKPAKTAIVPQTTVIPTPPPPAAAISTSPTVEISQPAPAEVPKPVRETQKLVISPAPAESRAHPQPADEATQHNAITERIKTEAEILDYTVTPQEFVPGSKKMIDLVLRRGKRTIACEISVTNTVEYEAATNIAKCVEAGFGQVASICTDRRKLSKIKERFAEMNPTQTAKVQFYTPDEFISKLFDWGTEDPEGGTIERGKPRKQKMSSEPLTPSQIKERGERMLKELRQAMQG
ncbi:MAG TPA: type IV secretion system DNA-binding domain-containing protein [Candidatus Saccharimonadales bacterium]|nr:type IV secretion system DNA-binding domain-containing protein [Candidatus Saccharimonadales bacterium]